MSNEEIIQDEKDAIRDELLQDEFQERRLRTDIDYFLEQNGFEQLKKDYDYLYKKMWDYGYYDNLKDYL